MPLSLSEKRVHVQQTLLSTGDEFLLQYLVGAHEALRETAILSRLFAMGHSLELYLKAALVDAEGVPPSGHNIARLLDRFGSAPRLTATELATGKHLYSPDTRTFDVDLNLEHLEAMELYQAIYFTVDLKYYLTKAQEVIFPVRVSTVPVNNRYAEMVRRIRAAVEHRHVEQDRALRGTMIALGLGDDVASRFGV